MPRSFPPAFSLPPRLPASFPKLNIVRSPGVDLTPLLDNYAARRSSAAPRQILYSPSALGQNFQTLLPRLQTRPSNQKPPVSIVGPSLNFDVMNPWNPSISPATVGLLGGIVNVDLTNIELSNVSRLLMQRKSIPGSSDDDLDLRGTSGHDEINGFAGNDILVGEDGHDILIGGFGKDQFFDGLGDDIFKYFRTMESLPGLLNRDIIHSLDSGFDKIDLSEIDADLGKPGDQSFRFIGERAFTGEAGQVRYYSRGSMSIVQVDIHNDGDRSADMEIQLNGVMSLSGSDFIL